MDIDMAQLTQAEAKHYFDYDSSAGILRRKIRTSNRIKVGDVAGTITNQGYLRVQVNGKLYLAHRVIWLWLHGTFPPNEIDHINGNKTDNKITNLRSVTHSENQRNSRLQKNNKSGIMGVYWHKQTKKWAAGITIQGKQIHLGEFSEIAAAIKIRKKAEIKYGFHPFHGRSA